PRSAPPAGARALLCAGARRAGPRLERGEPATRARIGEHDWGRGAGGRRRPARALRPRSREAARGRPGAGREARPRARCRALAVAERASDRGAGVGRAARRPRARAGARVVKRGAQAGVALAVIGLLLAAGHVSFQRTRAELAALAACEALSQG